MRVFPVFLTAGMLLLSLPGNAQHPPESADSPTLVSWWLDVSDLTENDARKVYTGTSGFLAIWKEPMGLGPEDAWVPVSAFTDNRGWTHALYRQEHRGIPVRGTGLVLHLRDGVVHKANGKIAPGLDVDTAPSLSPEEGEVRLEAEEGMAVRLTEPARLEILIPNQGDVHGGPRLAYRISFVTDEALVQGIRYLDAVTGQILLSLPTVCTGDVPGTANTLYNGIQTITTDEFAGGFRLQENGRPIRTQNLQHTTNLNFAIDFTDADNVWDEKIKVLRTVTLDNMQFPWWQTGGQPKPNIYLELRDGFNTIVARTPAIKDSFPSFTFPIQLPLRQPPYTVTFRDDDGDPMSDDFGGQFTVGMVPGVSNYTAFGNSGKYLIVEENDPALDAHWCMEETYDFFEETFNRTSYDGLGGQIRTYVHFAFGWPNAAWGTLDSRMFLGDGNGVQTTYRTYLNVVAHEFSHGVIFHNGGGGLEYTGESGALNESFADIFGAAAEFHIKPGNANWLHGEEGALVPGDYVRSMADPHSKQHPDTYGPEDPYWINPADTLDAGGIHTNSGVQNYWFYLLAEGGEGVNAKGDAYSVTGIGLDKALQIAYRNLTAYMIASTVPLFEDARAGSIMAAEDLYGAGSAEVAAVQAAWYAVGIGQGPEPPPWCSGLQELQDPQGGFSDGSGMAAYANGSQCAWRIQVDGANAITLSFTEFDVEDGKDFVYVYDGWDESAPLLAMATGTTIPGNVQSGDGIMYVKFVSDGDGTAGGWTAGYQTTTGSYCDSLTLFTLPVHEWSDGSEAENYGNNTWCQWLIQPASADSISLYVLELDTEEAQDVVEVFDGTDSTAPLLGVISGSVLPSPVHAVSGAMFVQFRTNASGRKPGWRLRYETTLSTGTEEENAMDNWQLFPSPTTGPVFLSVPEGRDGRISVQCFNQQGMRVRDVMLEVYPGQNPVMNLAGLPAGWYACRISGSGETDVFRIAVE